MAGASPAPRRLQRREWLRPQCQGPLSRRPATRTEADDEAGGPRIEHLAAPRSTRSLLSQPAERPAPVASMLAAASNRPPAIAAAGPLPVDPLRLARSPPLVALRTSRAHAPRAPRPRRHRGRARLPGTPRECDWPSGSLEAAISF